MELKNGTLLQGGKYKIEKTLGQGSFGITYLGEQVMLGRKVAIKEFFMKELNSRSEDGSITGMSDGSLSYNYGQKFRKEAQNLSGLDHPNIVRVIDCFEENATYYYVMDYIQGEDLNHYIKQHGIKESEAVSIIQDVAKALKYMHEEKHMLHLDLKPGNIMRRSSDGHIFLIDFGLSKHFSEGGQPETSTTIGLGTAGYAPVEQSNQARNGEFSPTIDVYALGATFYKLLTHDTPPAASDLVSDDDLIRRNLEAKNISRPLSNIIVSAMRPNVTKRTPDVQTFLDMLDNASSGDESTQVLGDESTQVLGTNTLVNTDSQPVTPVKPVIAPVMDDEPKSGNNGSKIIIAILVAIIACLIGFGVWYTMHNRSVQPTYASADSDTVYCDTTAAVDSTAGYDILAADTAASPEVEEVGSIPEEDVTLDGYFEKNGTQYPVRITFIQNGNEIYNCVYNNIQYNVTVKMKGKVTSDGYLFTAKVKGQPFTISLSYDDNGGTLSGYAENGSSVLDAHFDYSRECY